MVLFTGLANTLFAQTISFTPEHPQPGDSVTFSYDAKGGKLEGEEISAVVYHFDGTSIKASDMELISQGTLFRGEFISTSEDKVIFVKLRGSHPDIVETNNDKGVAVLMYKEDGKTPVSGAWGEYTKGVSWYDSFTVGLEPERKLGIQSLEKELTRYPENGLTYLPMLATLTGPSKKEKLLGWYEKFVSKIENIENSTEKELVAAVEVSVSLKDKSRTQSLKAKILKDFPNGDYVLEQQVEELGDISDLDKLEATVQNIEENYTQNKSYSIYESFISQILVYYYTIHNQFDKAVERINAVDNPIEKSHLLNEFAWGLSGEGFEKEAKELSLAIELSKESLDLLKKKESHSTKWRADDHSVLEWEAKIKLDYSYCADTYALLLYKNGQADSALHYQAQSLKVQTEEKEYYERYTVYMEAVKGPEETMAYLEKLIKTGSATRKMKKQYKRLAQGDGSSEFLAVMVDMDKEAMEKSMAELKNIELNEKAPDFVLSNLDGIEVSLESLKGKVIVLDFWATWCGPCIVSFPGMDKARKKFLEREDVIFLFVNTREKDGEEKNNVITFLEKEGYTFEVLMDDEDEMYEAYELEGIPTKVVIDKEGTMRFKKVGYYGDDDKMIKELSLMIEIVGAEE
ncbi:MAG: TlpA disulfide reductase family protein [Bacteroidota bacterium]